MCCRCKSTGLSAKVPFLSSIPLTYAIHSAPVWIPSQRWPRSERKREKIMNKFKKQELDGKAFADIDDAELGKALLESSTDTDTDTDTDTSSSTTSTSSRSWWYRWYKAIIGFSALLCATNLLTFWITASARPQCQTTESVAEPPSLTPMLRDLNLKTIHVKFDSTFYSQGSRYRKPPSPETDAAWNYAGANCMYHTYFIISQFVSVFATPSLYHCETDL